jgi:predicted RND superfamily exporter protein
MVGFISLTASGVIPVRQLGFLAAFGILLAWLLTLLVAPVLLRLLWSRAAPEHFYPSRWSRRITHGALYLAEKRPAWVLGMTGLLLVTLAGLFQLQADTDYVRFFRADSTLRADYEKIERSGFSQYYISLDLHYPSELVYTDNPPFDRVQQLEAAIEALPETHKVLSAGQLLREADRAMSGKRATAETFAGFDSARLAQLTLLAEASGNDDLNDLLTGDRARSQLMIMTDYLSTQQLTAFRARLQRLAHELLPDKLEARLTGTNVLWANMDASVIRTQIVSLLIVLGVISLLMPLLQGSLSLGLMGLAVSFLPVLFVLGFMGWTGIQVNMATCLIGGLAIGVAVDDTIYLLHRVRHEMAQGSDLRHAVRRGILVTGRAMSTTSLILMGGFLTMTLSDFMPSAEFGGLFAVTILLALLGDLLLLPLLLLHLPPRWKRTFHQVAKLT